jgi:hypothetical protein
METNSVSEMLYSLGTVNNRMQKLSYPKCIFSTAKFGDSDELLWRFVWALSI